MRPRLNYSLTPKSIVSAIVFAAIVVSSIWLFDDIDEPVKFQPAEATAGDCAVSRREEPQQLVDIFGDATLFYEGYELRKHIEKVSYRTNPQLEVSYAVLMKDGRTLHKFDGVSFGEGNDTEFGLFDLLGQDRRQFIVSQTVPRGGRHWVISVSPEVSVLFDSWDYGVGREEFYVIDIDKDGVYEISLPVTAFYGMSDKMYVAEIPLPEIVFKYDKNARKYLPANHLFVDYVLHGIDSDIKRLQSEDDSNYLSRRLHILLRYVYAQKPKEGWAFFDQEYKRADKEEIKARIRAVLKDVPVSLRGGPNKEGRPRERPSGRCQP